MRKTLRRLIFLCFALSLYGERAYYPNLPIKPETYHWELQNGLTILFWRTSSSDVVSIRAYVLSGSIYESKWLGSGISHYCEHVVSSGSTARRSEKEYTRILHEIGGRNNAYTTSDETCYHITTTKEHFYIADSIIFEWVSQCRFDPFEVEREKGVITQEILMNEKEPSTIMWRRLSENMFLHHPIRHPTIGYYKRFINLKREDLLEYYKERYQPQNTILSIAGDLDPDMVYSECAKVWGKWNRGSYYPPVMQDEPPLSISKVIEEKYSGKSAFFRLGFRGVASGSEYEFPLEFIAYILTGNESGRLKRKLKDELGVVTSIWAYNSSPKYGAGMFVIGGEFDYNKKDTLINLILHEIDSLGDFGPSDDELQTVKDTWFNSLLTSFEGAERLASIAASNWKYHRDIFPYQRIIEKAYTIKAKDIKEACQAILKDKPYTLVILHPGSEQPEPAYASKSNSQTCPPPFLTKLENGVRIISACNRDVPFFDLYLSVGGGVRFDPDEKEGLSSLLADYLSEGTRELPKEKLFTMLDRMGISLSISSGNNTISIRMKFPEERFDTSLSILKGLILTPAFDSSALPRLKREKLAELNRQESSWGSRLWNRFRENFFVTHPYRRNPLGSIRSINSITLDDIIAHYRKLFVGGNLVVALSGPKEADSIVSKLKWVLADLPAGVPEPPHFEKEQNTLDNKKIKIEDPGNQVSIAIGFRAPPIGDTLKAVGMVIDALLSGVSVPRGWLYENLRGKNDLVYLVSAGLWQGPDIGTFTITAQTEPRNFEKVLRIIDEQIERLIKGRFSEKDCEQAKKLLLLNSSFEKEHQSSRVENWALNELLTSDFQYDEKLLSIIERVKKEDIIRYANRFLINKKSIILFPKGVQ